MGYYLNVNFDLEFASTEALIQAAQRLQPEDVALVASPEVAWLVFEEAWAECGENAEINVPVTFDGKMKVYDATGEWASGEDAAPSELLRVYGWSTGKWYGGDYEKFSGALKGLAVGTFDFNEDIDAIWRERLHADGTITQHNGVIVYEGDEPDAPA